MVHLLMLDLLYIRFCTVETQRVTHYSLCRFYFRSSKRSIIGCNFTALPAPVVGRAPCSFILAFGEGPARPVVYAGHSWHSPQFCFGKMAADERKFSRTSCQRPMVPCMRITQQQLNSLRIKRNELLTIQFIWR